MPDDLDLTLYGPDHISRYRETNGETGYLWNGVPTLILTTKGRRTGKPRDSAMICASEANTHIVIASQGGAPTHPQWYLNLLADPHAEVQLKAEKFKAIARTAQGAERARLWTLMCDSWPRFDTYQQRTTRVIPVVVLERETP